MNNKRF